MNFPRDLDRLSFWLGFLASALLWLLLGRLRPVFAQLFANLKARSKGKRQERTLSDEIRLGNDTLRLLERWHLAAPLFSLDEIIVPPLLLAPAVPPMAYEPPPTEDITDWAIPYMIDWPDLASFYGAPRLGMAEALKGDAHLALIGQPGAGKTVALAYLASQIIRKDSEANHLEKYVPVLVHAADILLPPSSPDDALSSLLPAISDYVTTISGKRLPGFLRSVFKQERALLLVDGLDELSPDHLGQIVDYLDSLFHQYPGTRAVVTADPANLGRLPGLGFQCLPLTSWSQAQRALFISRWSDLWERHVAPSIKTKGSSSDPLLVIGWLLNTTTYLTPLELTLKVWAAFAGDTLGPTNMSAIEAYLRRMTAGLPRKNRPALEQLASQMTVNLQPVAGRSVVENWLGGSDMVSLETEPSAEAAQTEVPTGKRPERVRARGALPGLIDSGLLTLHASERVSIVHPAVAGYLAAQALARAGVGSQLVNQPDWSGKLVTLSFLAIMESPAGWVNTLLQDEMVDPLQHGLLIAGRWLHNTPEGVTWVPNVMRHLSTIVQRDQLPLSLKGRAISAMILAGYPGVTVLLRKMLETPQNDLRQLAILGLGALRDVKSVSEIMRLLRDRSPGVSRAALLALTAIGERTGMEAVASLLLTGDDSIRRAAAEALANHPEEGYPTLEEGSHLDDPGVRRAAVFGLGRTRQPWAIKIVENLRTEDSQWMVQDAANQVIQAIQEANPRLPRSLPSLTQMGWLVAFAAERGMGIAPGKAAGEMFNKALQEGTEDQRLAALYYLERNGEESAILPLYQAYFSSQGEMRERAFEALWTLRARGINLPPPIQFGFK